VDSESLGGKRLGDCDVIVAMEERHRDYVLSLCPECEDRVVVWNVRDSYFLDREDAWKVYEQIREKVAELAKSSEVPEWTWFGGKVLSNNNQPIFSAYLSQIIA
jgi:protein-tyrosine-phosphatase